MEIWVSKCGVSGNVGGASGSEQKEVPGSEFRVPGFLRSSAPEVSPTLKAAHLEFYVS